MVGMVDGKCDEFTAGWLVGRREGWVLGRRLGVADGCIEG
jgi:hypothetical protein